VASEAPSPRTTVRRQRQRGVYDATTIEAVLDEALICHVGAVVDGSPVVLPTVHARRGRTLYLHGAPANALLRAGDGAEVCVTATLVDGLVLARSAFHHSVNYRSVVVRGPARVVTDPDEQRAALEALVEHVAPGRSSETRAPSDQELRATLVLAVGLDEASAKVRTGPPLDEPEDHALPHWAGELPLAVVAGLPRPDPEQPADRPVPASVRSWRRP
jgi:nitroimidazol reductase NimA-like FMN-containing flavoprotein (pyridoxamine 5'-phosphate oxidase superfamily)